MAPLQLDLGVLIILKRCQNCQLSIVNCQFGEAAKQQFILPTIGFFLHYTFSGAEKIEGFFLEMCHFFGNLFPFFHGCITMVL